MRIVPPALLLLALSSCSALTGGAPEKTYVVFFTERSTAIDAAGQKVIADAARESKASPSKPVTVLGFTDSVGSAAADQTLSSERAQSVADALVADGIPTSTIRREGRGQTHEDPGVASRRVEIAVGD